MLTHRIISEFRHRDRDCTLGIVGPDLIAEVDGIELSGFYLDSADAYAAINRHIDAQEKEKRSCKK